MSAQQKQLHEGKTEKSASPNQPQEPNLKGEGSSRAGWFDAMSVVARRKLNAPTDWEWYAAKVLQPTDDSLIEGGVPNKRKDGTRRSGRNRWIGVVGQQCVVTQAEIDAARADYERDSGRCVDCAGTGETIAGVGIDGRRYRPCRRCGGEGRAPDSLAGASVLAVDKATQEPPSRSNPPAPEKTEAVITPLGS